MFDGHGGDECAKFAAKELPEILKGELTEYNKHAYNAQYESFKTPNELLKMAFISAFELLDLKYFKHFPYSE